MNKEDTNSHTLQLVSEFSSIAVLLCLNSPLASGTQMSTKSVTDHKKQEQLDSAPGKVLIDVFVITVISSIISFTIFFPLLSNVTRYIKVNTKMTIEKFC